MIYHNFQQVCVKRHIDFLIISSFVRPPVCLSELVKNYLFVSKLLSIGVYYCQLGRTILSLNISFCDAHRNEAIPRAETGINFEGDAHFLF